jgi:nicotinamide mononucleotide transporter
LSDPLDTLRTAAAAMSPWEVTAVVLAIAYLALAIRQSLWCWAAAFASTAIYLVLMYQAQLYMESGLQIFYLGMAVYGWYRWGHGPGPDHELPVTTWGGSQHARAVAAVLALSLVSGAALDAFSDAALPYLDSFTTWGAIVTTWMVARKVLENWLYWFVIDAVSIYLYFSRGLYLTALLFAIYLVMIVFGFLAWRKDLRRQACAAT